MGAATICQTTTVFIIRYIRFKISARFIKYEENKIFAFRMIFSIH